MERTTRQRQTGDVNHLPSEETAMFINESLNARQIIRLLLFVGVYGATAIGYFLFA